MRTKAFKLETQYEEELLKFQKKCNLKEIMDLEDYNNDLHYAGQSFAEVAAKKTLEHDAMMDDRKRLLKELEYA